MTDLRANGLWKGIRHRPMVERAEESPFAVHRQVARRPDRWCAHVAGKNGVLGAELVERSSDILRMDSFLPGFTGRKFIESLPRLLIMFERSLQMLVVLVLAQLWQERLEGGLRVPDQAVVQLGSPAELFTTEINLGDCRILGKELLVWEVRSDHQQKVAVH